MYLFFLGTRDQRMEGWHLSPATDLSAHPLLLLGRHFFSFYFIFCFWRMHIKLITLQIADADSVSPNSFSLREVQQTPGLGVFCWDATFHTCPSGSGSFPLAWWFSLLVVGAGACLTYMQHPIYIWGERSADNLRNNVINLLFLPKSLGGSVCLSCFVILKGGILYLFV